MEKNVNQNNNMDNIKGFEGEFLHPSLDIKGDLLILGFRYIAKNREEKEIFLIIKAGVIKILSEDFFEFNGKKYFLEKRGKKLIRLEEKWSLQELNEFLKEYRSSRPLPKLKEVYKKIKELLKKYIELEKEIDYSLVTVWAIGTYFSPIFSAYPFLNVKAPKRSGKSQCLNLLKQICFNAVKARPSLAALSDTVDSLRGTYLIDQADTLRRKGNEDLVDILADSYKKEGGKRRIMVPAKRGGWKPREYETYGPKVFASIGELPEDLSDRCLIIPLIRSQKNFPEPNEENENWREIRGKLYKILIDNYPIIENTYNVHKVNYRIEPEVVGRELELWLPFEIMFICSGAQDEIEEAKKRFRKLYGYTEYEPSEFEEEVIKAVLNQFQNETEIILSPKQISEDMDSEVFSPQEDSRQRSAKVGWTIKKFNLSSEKKPRTKEGIRYLFKKNRVENIYNSYLKTVNNLPSLTPQPEMNSN